jgi:hypothetical protein
MRGEERSGGILSRVDFPLVNCHFSSVIVGIAAGLITGHNDK